MLFRSSTNATPPPPPPPVKPKVKSGVRSALEYTGIPPSWLEKRPKLPSRNWLIFLSTTSAITGWYFYDRSECKRIKAEYVERVQHLAEVSGDTLERPRRVAVFGCRWPGDEEYEQSLKYFRKYVKPILVAAAVDYDLIKCKRQGDLAAYVEDQTRARRRLDAGLDSDPEPLRMLPTYKNPQERRQVELQGGWVVVGRPALKELLAGLYRGWNGTLARVDREEALANELESDGHFDEPLEDESEPTSTPKPPPITPAHTSPVLGALATQLSQSQSQPRPSRSSTPEEIPTTDPTAPIPALPPIALVPFLNHIGIPQVPLMILDFFNQRHKVRSGSEMGYQIVMGATRPFNASPSSSSESDLDFGLETESYFKSSLNKRPQEIEEARDKYYKSLAEKLKTARAIARGTREMTTEEQNNPPPTEVELRAERMKKELLWRRDLEGWEIVKPGQPPVWDDRFNEALRVFTDPTN